jgi:hypothetical protein
MNYSGSYRNLVKNSEAALLASIEIYNKPQIKYRDECFVILLLNAWELLLKAIISKNKQSIFYRKKQNQPYRTLSLSDALNRSNRYFPKSMPVLAIRRNLELLTTYRDNAVHFYNEKGFSAVIYSLAQTSIKNFKDLVDEVFNRDLVSEISWSLLPLGFRLPIDPISYIGGKNGYAYKKNSAVGQFMFELRNNLEELEKEKIDSERLLTVFNVKLESVKKISKADVVIGVGSGGVATTVGPLAIVKSVDPNKSHPLKQKDILFSIKTLQNIKFTSYIFQAIVWKYKVRENIMLCWRSEDGALTKYSNEITPFLRNLSKAEIQRAITDYKKR